MAPSDTPPLSMIPSPISGQVLFYQRPEPLDPRTHANLGMRRTDRPFGFAAKQHFIPLHVGEFGPAATNYPIIFAGDQKTPLAVMGIAPGENLYISEDGQYRPGCYVPSFIRRYPFVAAHDADAQRSIVCIDRASDLFVENGGDVKLFENGEASEFTKNCIEFCKQFDQDKAQNDFFLKLLIDLDLFEPRKANWVPQNEDGTAGEPQMLADFFAVSESKLKALPEKTIIEMRDNGALAQIYAHMVSLWSWDRIIAESVVRRVAAMPTPANA